MSQVLTVPEGLYVEISVVKQPLRSNFMGVASTRVSMGNNNSIFYGLMYYHYRTAMTPVLYISEVGFEMFNSEFFVK